MKTAAYRPSTQDRTGEPARRPSSTKEQTSIGVGIGTPEPINASQGMEDHDSDTDADPDPDHCRRIRISTSGFAATQQVVSMSRSL